MHCLPAVPALGGASLLSRDQFKFAMTPISRQRIKSEIVNPFWSSQYKHVLAPTLRSRQPEMPHIAGGVLVGCARLRNVTRDRV
jgi:hypothetical protein